MNEVINNLEAQIETLHKARADLHHRHWDLYEETLNEAITDKINELSVRIKAQYTQIANSYITELLSSTPKGNLK